MSCFACRYSCLCQQLQYSCVLNHDDPLSGQLPPLLFVSQALLSELSVPARPKFQIETRVGIVLGLHTFILFQSKVHCGEDIFNGRSCHDPTCAAQQLLTATKSTEQDRNGTAPVQGLGQFLLLVRNITNILDRTIRVNEVSSVSYNR